MAYATINDIEERMGRELSGKEETSCIHLLDDAAVLIDSFNPEADPEVKTVVTCRVVIRAIGDGSSEGIPVGATQGSMSALGYSQSWTIGSGGATGELYLGKTEKRMLGIGNRIGSYSPVEDLVPEVTI